MADAMRDTFFKFADDSVRVSMPIAEQLRHAVKAGEAIHLEVPEHLRKEFEDGAIEFLKSKHGDTAILMRKETGKFAGHASVVEGEIALLNPAVAWKLIAVATQQKYLHDINEKLGAIVEGIGGLTERMQHEHVGDLLAVRAALTARHDSLAAGVAPSDHAVAEAQRWEVEVDAIRHKALLNVAAAGRKETNVRSRKAIFKGLAAMADAPTRDYRIALFATELLLGVRSYVLEGHDRRG